MRGGLPLVLGTGIRPEYPRKRCQTLVIDLPFSSGVQLHPTSLPGGRLGADAYAFVDWLAEAGQTWWQMLPLGPPDRHRSPYKAASAFAAWPGLLAEPQAPVSRRGARLPRARALLDRGLAGPRGAVADQVRFDREWAALRAYAAERGVRLIGDVPIYVAPGSADHRAIPSCSRPAWWRACRPTPSPTGPAVGQPALRLAGDAAPRLPLVDRALRRTFDLFDLARIDHFRASWPTGRCRRARSTRHGRWRRGPGRAVFDAAVESWSPAAADRREPRRHHAGGRAAARRPRPAGNGGAPVRLRPRRHGQHRHPRNHIEHPVVYTGTHDHDTVRGWYESLRAERRALADRASTRRACASTSRGGR